MSVLEFLQVICAERMIFDVKKIFEAIERKIKNYVVIIALTIEITLCL